MRHLTGIVLAIVMTAAVFFAATWGYVRLAAQSSRLAAAASLLSDHHALLALGALAGAGLLAGILIAAPRISPLAAGLPGLLLLGVTAFYLVSVRRADELIPLRSHVFGAGFETLLAHGLLAAAGLAMIVPLFVPSRWRAWRRADPAAEFEPMADDGDLVQVFPAGGDLPVTGAAGGAGVPAAQPPAQFAQPARRTQPAQPWAGAGAAPAQPATAPGSALPHRSPPAGIAY